MSLNQSFIYLFRISQNIHADLKGPKVKYKLSLGFPKNLSLGFPTR